MKEVIAVITPTKVAPKIEETKKEALTSSSSSNISTDEASSEDGKIESRSKSCSKISYLFSRCSSKRYLNRLLIDLVCYLLEGEAAFFSSESESEEESSSDEDEEESDSEEDK